MRFNLIIKILILYQRIKISKLKFILFYNKCISSAFDSFYFVVFCLHVAGPNGSNATQLRNMLVAWKNLRNSKCDATLLLEKKEYSFLFYFVLVRNEYSFACIN
jgi:hypothetical protein